MGERLSSKQMTGVRFSVSALGEGWAVGRLNGVLVPGYRRGFDSCTLSHVRVAKLAKAPHSNCGFCGFDSRLGHHAVVAQLVERRLA